MPEVVFGSNCELVQRQLAPLAETHRLTVICGLVAPASGKIALVQTAKSEQEERMELGLKLPQGGIEAGEFIGDAYIREIGEELGVEPHYIRRVEGLPTSPVPTGGRARDGKQSKAFGVLCGLTDFRPELKPPANEIAAAGWYDIEVAERVFRAQAANESTRGRGQRSLGALEAIQRFLSRRR